MGSEKVGVARLRKALKAEDWKSKNKLDATCRKLFRAKN